MSENPDEDRTQPTTVTVDRATRERYQRRNALPPPDWPSGLGGWPLNPRASRGGCTPVQRLSPSRIDGKCRIASVLLALFSMLLSVAVPGRALAEDFHTSAVAATTPVRVCTNLDDTSCSKWTSIAKGNTVSMVCWRKEGPATDSRNFGTDMYFWVKGKTGSGNSGSTVQGYVSANHVSNQWKTAPSCSSKLPFKAALWAGRQRGQTNYDGLCQTYVHKAFLSGAGVDIGSVGSSRGAIDFWKGYPNQSYLTGENRGYLGRKIATTSNMNAPVGALVFWSGGTYGHVAMSIGNGWVLSSKYGGTEGIRVFRISSYWNNYLGWIEFPNSVG